MKREEKFRLLMGAMLNTVDTLTEEEAEGIFYDISKSAEYEDCGLSALRQELFSGAQVIKTKPDLFADRLTLTVFNDREVELSLFEIKASAEGEHFDVSVCRLTERGRPTELGMRYIGDALMRATRSRIYDEILTRHGGVYPPGFCRKERKQYVDR